MSGNKTNVRLILERLHQSSDIIAEAYENSRISESEDTFKKITLLRQLRILTTDIHDTFQLRYSMRQFLNSVLNTSKLMDSGTDFSISFSRLDEFVNRHNDAFLESRDEDRFNYEIRIRDSINEISGAIEDELLHISSLVDSKFATVTTLAEKTKENIWYMNRTKSILELLETFSFSDVEQRLRGHRDLELTFDLLLKSRMTKFIDTLKSILTRLSEYLYEFRKIEAQAKLLRNFSNHLSRYPDWQPKDWSGNETLTDWMSISKPLTLKFYPDIDASVSEDLMVEIAENLPAFKPLPGLTKKRPAGELIEMTDAPVITYVPSGMQLAVINYIKTALMTEGGLSARQWWLNNPAELNNIGEEYWLQRILSEKQNRKIGTKVNIELVGHESENYDGNIRVLDIIVSKGYANV